MDLTPKSLPSRMSVSLSRSIWKSFGYSIQPRIPPLSWDLPARTCLVDRPTALSEKMRIVTDRVVYQSMLEFCRTGHRTKFLYAIHRFSVDCVSSYASARSCNCQLMAASWYIFGCSATSQISPGVRCSVNILLGLGFLPFSGTSLRVCAR